ncbi:MAG TPA: bifunctional UDP-N-acetylglucosamine diphosphorylase/glucosamine-1-phosphate N-acetyltransferase GlmU [Mycobacteriales bacterium]|nr:bifunctional UDP-N-acetylglucosamine diphosphorylase/glucosamine-1-phosphate N-acetyltransferase GlmU [Mycobacteriales bacterium]
MPSARPAAVIVLAAGEGTRMRSATPKVLHRLGGRTMLGHVLAAAEALDPEHLLVVVGHGREAVTASLTGKARAVVQETQDGTGHAVRVALETIEDLDGTVVVLPGDSPLLTGSTLQALVDEHQQADAATTLLTARVQDPTGYGRVVRDEQGVRAVVEHKDADAATLAIDEVATSVYAFAAGPLRAALGGLTTDNAQGELYLTDVVAAHRAEGRTVVAKVADDAEETLGCNDRAQLADLARRLRDRTNAAHLRAGVAILDPQTTWVDVDVVLEADCTIAQGTQLQGSTVVRRGAVVGPDTTLVDCEVGEGATVLRTHATGAVVGKDASVGPFSYLRPGTVLGEGAKVGAYVEVKASEIGAGSKVPHLAYVGDATIGERSNIGAGTIVVNYDGVAKHRTTIGDDVRVGSNNSLVAPVTVHDGAYTAAGSAITEDVPQGALAVGRAKQSTIEGWVARKRPAKGESS